MVEDREIVDGTLSESSTLLVGERSNYARSKLDQLHEKLNNKMQALQALKSSLKPESKVLSILAKEVEWLQGEKRQLEAHLNHTEMWAEHLGRWRADVQSAEVFNMNFFLYIQKDFFMIFLLNRCLITGILHNLYWLSTWQRMKTMMKAYQADGWC